MIATKITYDELHKEFVYLPETGLLINKKRGRVEGRLNEAGYLSVTFMGKTYPLHRVVYFMYHGYLPKEHTDHINRIKTDNRIANLRAVSCSTNLKNSGTGKANKSGVKGVSWNIQDNRWAVLISYKKKQIYLGKYKHFRNAVKVRYYAEQKFGYLNDGIISPAQKYLNNSKKITFVTNIDFKKERQIAKNTIASEWAFFCCKGMKRIDKLAET